MRARLLVIIQLAISASIFGGCGDTPNASSQMVIEKDADIPRIVAAEEARVHLPPGGRYNPAPLALLPNHHAERGRFEALVQQQAFCQWYRYWLAGFERQDREQIARAQVGYRQLHGFSYYAKSDVSVRNYIDLVEGKADLGDPSELQNYLTVNCATSP